MSWGNNANPDQMLHSMSSGSILIVKCPFTYNMVSRFKHGMQWLSQLSVKLGIKGLLVRVSSLTESLCCVLEQDTLFTA